MSINNLTPALRDFPSYCLGASSKQQTAPRCMAWRNQVGDGGTSHFSVRNFFSLDLLHIDLLFGEVRDVVGEVRLIFDLMAPFILDCSPGKVFPIGDAAFFTAESLQRERCGRS